jgi:hypothetical protein
MPESKEEKKTKTKPGQASAKATPVSEKKTPVAKKPTVAKKPIAPPPPPVQHPLISFDRWFRGKGFKAHWKPAMKVYANTSGRRSGAEWDQLFENY